LTDAEKVELGVIVQSPYADNVRGPSTSRFHVDLPDTEGEIVKILDGATGVTLLEAPLAGPVPVAFVAVTVNVYAVPFVKPETVIGEDDPVPVKPPGLEVTV